MIRLQRKSDKFATASVALCLLCVVVTVFVVAPVTVDTARLARENEDRIRDVTALTKRVDAGADVTTGALCALRVDLEKRVASSKAFLREHPHGIRDISAKLIRDGIRNQERTIKALRSLSCQ